ncbi:hypothetical protein F4803DRAFT_533574 [Xylaria telfairii]|nr:hypothetical protein F4803DRAFT_533574 [Xylaria telfairii]
MAMGIFSKTHQYIFQSVLTPDEIPCSVRLSMKMAILGKDDYPITSAANLSYYHSTSTAPEFSPTSFTTIIISRTAAITLTTIVLITSGNTITTTAPLSAPFLSSQPAKVILSPANIAGIIVGVIAGLLVLVALFYLLLTRAKWLIRFSNYRLEKKEKEYRRKKRRSQKGGKRPAEKMHRTSGSKSRTSDGRWMESQRTTKTTVASTLGMLEQRHREWIERFEAFEAGIMGTGKATHDDNMTANRGELE